MAAVVIWHELLPLAPPAFMLPSVLNPASPLPEIDVDCALQIQCITVRCALPRRRRRSCAQALFTYVVIAQNIVKATRRWHRLCGTFGRMRGQRQTEGALGYVSVREYSCMGFGDLQCTLHMHTHLSVGGRSRSSRVCAPLPMREAGHSMSRISCYMRAQRACACRTARAGESERMR